MSVSNTALTALCWAAIASSHEARKRSPNNRIATEQRLAAMTHTTSYSAGEQGRPYHGPSWRRRLGRDS